MTVEWNLHHVHVYVINGLVPRPHLAFNIISHVSKVRGPSVFNEGLQDQLSRYILGKKWRRSKQPFWAKRTRQKACWNDNSWSDFIVPMQLQVCTNCCCSVTTCAVCVSKYSVYSINALWVLCTCRVTMPYGYATADSVRKQEPRRYAKLIAC